MEEIWKEVKGFPNYKISNTGKVYTLNYNRVLKICLDKDGYPIVHLCNNKKVKRYFVHRLVGLHFLDNSNNYPQINHKDGIKTNNNVDNLEWVTVQQNVQHSFDAGLKEGVRGIKNHNCKLTEKDVSEIRELLSQKTPLTKIGKIYGVSFQQISRIKLNLRWKHL